jgi:ribokinase
VNEHVVVVGSLNMDLVVQTPHLPAMGETILGSSFRTIPGGKGANQAVAAARMGAPVKMIGRVGEDAFGASLLQNLRDAGVDAAFVRALPGASTGVALITVDQGGRNTIVVDPGANGQLRPDDVLAAEDAFNGAGVLVTQLECPLEAVQQAVALARRHRLHVILNPAPALPLEPAFLAQVDTLIPNQTEVGLLTRQDDVGAAVTCLHGWGVRCVIVTLGERGALVSEDGRVTAIPPHPVTAVDTTAAGDAFVAAFAVEITRGGSTLAAARWGNAAGALAVTRSGAQPSLPTRREVEALLTQAA